MLKKSKFLQRELKFLGHVITQDGIKPNEDKLLAVKEWPTPQTQTDVGAFTGLTNYFKKHVKGYSDIVAPLFA